MKKIIYFIAACGLLLTSCSKDDTLVQNTEYEKVAPGDPKYSYIKFLNLTPGSPTVNYYLDGTKFSAALSSLGVENAGYTYNGLFPDLGYAVTLPGSHALTAKIIPSATVDKNLEVLNTTINPAAGKYYTILTSGQYSATNKSIGPIIVLDDVRPATDTTKVFVRMVNLLNGGPAIDLVRGDVNTGPKLIPNVALGTASGWAEVANPGSGSAPIVKFWLNNATTGAALLTTVYQPSLTKGRAYTIYIRGVVGSTTFAPTISTYTTFY